MFTFQNEETTKIRSFMVDFKKNRKKLELECYNDFYNRLIEEIKHNLTRYIFVTKYYVQLERVDIEDYDYTKALLFLYKKLSTISILQISVELPNILIITITGGQVKKKQQKRLNRLKLIKRLAQ